MSSVLITGIAGFIGSNLADFLLSKSYKVIGIDNLSYGLMEQVPKDIEFYKEDIRSHDIYQLFEDIDVVFHLAAKNCIADCQLDPVETADINITGTVNVFEACKKADVEKVIFAESSALYEGSTVFPTPENREAPESFYAVSKYAEKYFAEAYLRFFDMNITALRYFNVYGPKQDYRRTIPPLMSTIIINLLQGKRPNIYGDGSKRRDYIYVDDVNRFHEMLISDERTNGKTYNIGSGKNYSVLEIYEAIDNILKTGIKPIFKPDLPGEAFQNLADISKSNELGWKPEIPLEQGLKLSIDYIRNNVLNAS